MLIFIVESSPESLETYCNFLRDYLKGKGMAVRVTSFGEKVSDDIDALIVRGSFLTYKGDMVSLEERFLFGDHLLLFRSAGISGSVLKKAGLNFYEIRDKTFPTSMLRILNGITLGR